MHDDACSEDVVSVTRQLAAETDTLALGAHLASALAPGMVVYLRGELGAGKTTLARGVLCGLGHAGKVKSPTYTLVEVYEVSRLYLYHFDFYRLDDPHAWIDAGLREHFDETSICLVEWPERAGDSLPPADLEIRLDVDGEQRRATLLGRTPAGRRCLAALDP